MWFDSPEDEILDLTTEEVLYGFSATVQTVNTVDENGTNLNMSYPYSPATILLTLYCSAFVFWI